MNVQWSIEGTKLRFDIYYRKQNETSEGTSGCSTSWFQEITTTIKDAAEIIIANVKVDWNWRAMEGLNDWTKLVEDV
jgi:hypothetical protein